jgi:hypothetical protein
LIPSPIVKVLSTIQKNGVRALLMGGQACVFYGAAEFSRDVDVVVLADAANLARLTGALAELQAKRIAVPDFEESFLHRGHAVHFRCGTREAQGIRVDIMSKLRGVDDFAKLWERRTTLADDSGNEYHLLSLPDLVQAKKTQRDKDWPMITRLVEANYQANLDHPTDEQVRFWLREMRSPELLMKVTRAHPSVARELESSRPLLTHAFSGEIALLESALLAEQHAERDADRVYWQPLKQELEQLRMAKR